MSQLTTSITSPDQIYPQILDLNFYNTSLPTINTTWNVIEIKSYKPVSDLGGKIATMAKVELLLQHKLQNDIKPISLRLIIKAMLDSPAVLMSSREVLIYRDIIQPLLLDFKDDDILLNNTTIHNQFHHIFPSTLSQSFPNKELYLQHIQSREQFKAPYYYYGETNEQHGKLLLLAELYENSGHSGCFFGDVPHNQNYDITTMLKLYPTTTQFDITIKAFSSIAQLHAKYWNNQYTNIPNYMPSYKWYFPENDDDSIVAENEYNEFIQFGMNGWKSSLNARITDGLIVSDYFKSIVNAMIEKSTWKQFQQQYNYNINPNRIPLTIIHCDYFPHNTMISSSTNCTGMVYEQQHDINTSRDTTTETTTATTTQSTLLTPHFFTIDYEFTCVSSPMQDLAQWAISQVDPTLLAEKEDELLSLYYEQLQYYYYLYQYQYSQQQSTTSINVESKSSQESLQTNEFAIKYPLSSLKQDYINACTKWIWLVMVSCGLNDNLPTSMLPFFINQIESFLQRHNITPDNAPLLRR